MEQIRGLGLVQWKKLLQVRLLMKPLMFKKNILSFRERCMDLVSFDTADEYRHFAKIMFRGNIVIVIAIVIVSMLILRMINCTCIRRHLFFVYICRIILCFVSWFTVTHSKFRDHNNNALPNS